MGTTNDDEVARLIAASRPDVPDPADADITRVWNRVEVALDATPVRRRRLKVVLGAGVAAVVLGSTGVAAAGIYSARTGEGHGDAEDLALGGPGERLDPAGTDFRVVVAEEAADIPFPSVGVREETIDFWTADLTRDNPLPGTSGVSTGALRAWIAQDAICSWANQWAASTRSRDAAARAEAISMIDAADTWPAVKALDPAPSTWMETIETEDENGEVTSEPWPGESHFYYLGRVEDAAHGVDLDAMAAALRSGGRGCWGYEVPDLPMADPMYAEEHGRGE